MRHRVSLIVTDGDMTDVLNVMDERCRTIIRLSNAMCECAAHHVFSMRLPNVPSNTVGSQFWCVNGARESYTTALTAGRWVGFDNSLPQELDGDKEAVLSALERSQEAFFSAFYSLGDAVVRDVSRLNIILRLIEHEASHHGQLIRYWYALNQQFPPEFARKYSLD